MNTRDLIEHMNVYYSKRASRHDHFMGYTGNEEMERLLGPMIEWFEDDVRGKDVLEIACGTGNWTQVLAKRARSVVATDVNTNIIELARTKTYDNDRVRFEIADAYDLGKIDGSFDAAFAADWWAHIPKAALRTFITGLKDRLRPRSRVIIVDMLPREELNRWFSHYDDDGNLIHKRDFPDGEVFEVVKNFPTEAELLEVLSGFADDVKYREHEALRRWMLTFTTR
jgi:demethylmenaquinone methyltransferase/2-methoxy-6-polyprenyl-1,4-benzoquinol methylase